MSIIGTSQNTNIAGAAFNNDKPNVANFIPDAVAGGSKSEQSKMRLDTDFTHFIKMLTTQLKNQDPTEPMDSDKFTQQIVAFTEVEQSVVTNNNLEKLIELNKGVQFNHASSLVGKEVVYDGSIAELKHGDSVDFSYLLEPSEKQNIGNTSVKILNSSGTIVRTINGEVSGGVHNLHWDGLDFNNRKCPKDVYKMQVHSTDKDGNPVTVGSSKMSGNVSEAEIDGGAVFLKVNGKKVPITQIKSLKDKVIQNAQNQNVQTKLEANSKQG